ncbi:hypothetical protein SCHPADRAFT_935065 [Schizopora paradoxa]|uniref:F-box domain-containing protein n=1 Tax=Schizopora paradoxa TaxID=27342 RepID=A0A0H2SE26_9AGAM|nr:hypothetical protein SCHPADRAFT_935065 [Schizopora paradoxa]
MDQQASSIQVDVVGLKKLYRCITDLRYSSGQANPHDLWTDELFVPNFVYPLTPVNARDVHSMASHIESLERARRLLYHIGGLLDERIHTLTSQTSKVFAAFGRGLESLPYEVLAIILEQAADLKSEDPKSPLRLSHVSRRFRSVMLSLPKAWCAISSDMDSEWVDTVLARSRSSGMQVQFKGVNDFGDAIHSLAHTLPFSDRWRSFALHAAFRPDLDAVSQFSDFRKRCLDLKLPRLVHAEFHFDDNHPISIEARHPDIHLFTTWDAPNLRSLTMTNSIPNLFNSPNLTKFTMRFECLTTFAQRNLRPFFAFLAGNPQLKELALHFSCYFPAILQTPRLVHTTIESLSIEVEYAEFEWIPQRAAILAILTSMSLPKLTALDVNATFEGGKSTSDYWDDEDDISEDDDGLEVSDMLFDMLPLPGLCPAIKRCSLRVLGYELTHPELSLHRVLHAMPNLEHLRIDTNLDLESSMCTCPVASASPSEMLVWPKIRTLELNHCEDVIIDWVEDFVSWLQRAPGAWERFEMLTVRACAELQKAELLEFIPKEKLTWVKEIMFEEEHENDPLEGAFEDGLFSDGSNKEAPLYMFDDECVGTRLIF